MTLSDFPLLAVLGFAVGAFGTLVGAGGGFILMPVLTLLYPSAPADQLTAVSLTVVFLNAFSGSLAYAKGKRIDYRAGLVFAAASIPGAVLGAFSTTYLPRKVFDPVFSALLMLAGVYLFLRPKGGDVETNGGQAPFATNSLSKKYGLGIALSAGVGFLSSVLGIGGGIIHVPALIHLLNYPAQMATATSHFVLAITSFAGMLVHIYQGTWISGAHEVKILAPGVIIGAQVGAFLSHKVHGSFITRVLALALVLVGFRLLVSN